MTNLLPLDKPFAVPTGNNANILSSVTLVILVASVITFAILILPVAGTEVEPATAFVVVFKYT